NHLGSTGEWNYGISIKGCEDIMVIDCISNHFWGDGIAIQASKKTIDGVLDINYSSRVQVIRGEYNYNRRNGISIISCNKFYGENLVAKYNGTINGTNPRYGVDIEPDNGGYDYIDVVINGLYTEGNSEGGIEIVPAYMQDVRYTSTGVFKVKLDNWVSESDAVSSERRGTLRVVCADTTLANIIETKPIEGYINITNSTIIDSGRRPVSFSRVSDNGLSISLINTNIINPCTLETDASVEVSNALAFSTASVNTSYGKIVIDGYYISDNSNSLATGVYFKPANETDGFKDVTINNLSYEGQWSYPNEVPTYGAVDKSVSVNFSEIPKVFLSTSGILRDYSVVNYMEVTMTAANTVRSLPDSTKVKRKRIKYIANIASDQICYLEGKNDNQPININPRNSKRIVLTGGSTVTVDLADNGTWNIIDYSGIIYNDGFPVKGTTSQKPTGLLSSNAGFQYYDTTLKSYIVWDGTVWSQVVQPTYINATTASFNLYADTKIKTIELTPPGNMEILLKPSTDNMLGALIFLRNNTNFNITLKCDTGVAIMGSTTFNSVLMTKRGESIMLVCNSSNQWRYIILNKIDTFVPQIATANATDLPTALQLVNDCKIAINSILQTSIDSGQRASS
ncbi:MAG: hypothetical protein ACOVRK_09330, partial [Chryseobacterium taeanense]